MSVMTDSSTHFRSQLPWSSSDKENRFFNKLTSVVLVVTLIFALVVKLQQLPEQTREEKERVPPQLTRIIKAQQVQPPKPVEPPKPIPVEAPPEPVKVEPKVEPKPPKAVPKKPVEQPTPKPVVKQPTEAERAAQARAKARQTGLLQFTDDLNSMRESANISNLADTDMIKGAGKTKQQQRAFVGKKVADKSSGLNTSKLSSDVGARGELSGRKSTEFQAPNEGLASLAAKQLVTEETVVGSRDEESIRKGFGANKGALYTIYRRALRDDPSLQGKITVNLEIAPDGSVALIQLLSSELDYPELEAKLLARIKLINFGGANVTATTTNYSLDFFPF